MVVAIRQPSEDKEFWHSEMVKEEMVGGVVSEEEDDDEEEPASSAGKLEDDDSLEEPASDEEDEAGKLDEPASSAGKLAEDELSATPVPPPPKPGIIVVANFGWPTSMSRFRLDIDVSSTAGTPSRLNLDVWAICKTRACFCKSWSDSSASLNLSGDLSAEEEEEAGLS